MPINREQALVVLYDLAFTIGNEVKLDALLKKTLQRFLYHTGFPTGLIVVDESIVGQSGRALIEHVIGDFKLLSRRKEIVPLALELLSTESKLIEQKGLLGDIETSRPYRMALTMPIPDFGHMILLGTELPASSLPFTNIFQPLLSRLGTAVKLCQTYEREVQRRIERESHYDPLTDLPNAQLFKTTLNEALSHGGKTNRMLAVVQLDLDDFAGINAKLGQSGGDQVLAMFAQRLKATPWFYAAHIMGDEFALLISDVTDREEAWDRLIKILEPENLTIRIDDTRIQLQASAGISLYPVDATDADTLMRHARMALDDAKRDAHGTLRWFDNEENRIARERRNMIDRVRGALQRGELIFFYQPQLDLRTNEIYGFEALLRWNNEDSIVLPGAFLAAIENNDLICEIGRFAIRKAAEQSVQWRRLGLPCHISVNIATRHLQQPAFTEEIKAIIESVPDARMTDIEIEILETTAIQDFDITRNVILRCTELGIRVALDDFGTGYSSLAYLSLLPVQTLKIDRMFVTQMMYEKQRRAVVQAVINIAGVFGHHVVAEGVETDEQQQALTDMGCHAIQGYYLAAPMPDDQVPTWVPS